MTRNEVEDLIDYALDAPEMTRDELRRRLADYGQTMLARGRSSGCARERQRLRELLGL